MRHTLEEGELMKRTRGQVLVLACLSMLMIGLMLMLSFNVTQAIHEKVRIQATADAQALSTATLEARALNTMAFMNRSIAGAMVAEMAIHAWWTIAESEVGMLSGGNIAMLQVAGVESGMCSPYQPQHCKDAAEAAKIAMKYQQKNQSYKGKLNGLKGSFQSAVSGLQGMMKSLYADQKKVLNNTKNEIAVTSQTFRNLKSLSAPRAQYLDVNGMNVSEFACALEGSDFDGQCQGQSWKSAGQKSSDGQRGMIMESAAMAARPKFEIGNAYWRQLGHGDFNAGGASAPAMDMPMPKALNDPREPKNIQSEGTFKVTGMTMPKTWAKSNKVGAEISPQAPSMVNITWRHGSGVGIVGDPGPQRKKESGSPYVGLPCGGDNCFINFRANTNSNGDFGQPATYGALRQDLRLQLNGQRGPWEVNKDGSGTIKIKLQRNRETRLVLVPQGQAYAVAKGKTYFHQLGSWQTPPNMFDPFWRAKLQSFQKDELRSLLSRIGDTQGANIIGSGGAIEGKLQ